MVNVDNGCSPVAGANVDIWQCDADGHYSQYAQPGYNGQSESYLRGIQTTDGAGRVTFTTIYPGWYAGRATHSHVDVAVNGRSVKVTQIAFPESVTAALYATGVYAAKGQNPTNNARDNVFADSVASEMAEVTGGPTAGYNATFTVGIAISPVIELFSLRQATEARRHGVTQRNLLWVSVSSWPVEVEQAAS